MTPANTFERLYGYYDRVLRFLLKYGVPHDRAQDLAQETFVRVYNALPTYRGEAEWAYLESIARNVLLNDVRASHALKRARLVPSGDMVDLAAAYPIAAPSDLEGEFLSAETLAQQRSMFRVALSQLPHESAETLRLWLAGLKYSEIAKVTRSPEPTVRLRLARVRQTLRAYAAGQLPESAESAHLVSDVLEPIEGAPVSAPSLIFQPPPPSVHVPALIVSVENALIEAIRSEPRSIFGISSRAFEELMAEIFKGQGFQTELTKATRDGGRDIIAIHEILGIRSKYIVECKRYAEHRKVSLQLVQRLYGVKMAENANKAILATTSSFTRDAREFASHHLWDLELKAFDDIIQWIRNYRMAPSA